MAVKLTGGAPHMARRKWRTILLFGIFAIFVAVLLVEVNFGALDAIRLSCVSGSELVCFISWESRQTRSTRRCHAGCTERGNCNPELGECRCAKGFTGPTCSEFAMPRCNLDPGYSFPSCQTATACGCHLDCEEHRIPHHNLCFDDLRKDGTLERNITKIYESPLVRLVTDEMGNETGARIPAAEEENAKNPFINPLLCPMNCSGTGACLKDSSTCRCFAGYGGSSCEVVLTSPMLCPNNCSGHGTCKGHFCYCKRGYFGPDCAQFVNDLGKMQLVPRSHYSWVKALPLFDARPVTPRVYVYDLPGDFHIHIFGHGFQVERPEQILLFDRLLATPHRTANGEEADYFFAPIFLRLYNRERGQVLQKLIKYISATWPYYNRSNGSDHIFLTNDDWGNCEVLIHGDDGRPLLMRGIAMSLWGYTKRRDMQEGTPEDPACFRRGVDIAVPPTASKKLVAQVPWILPEAEKVKEDMERTILMYFVGFRGGDEEVGGWKWSNGVRQILFDNFLGKDNETGFLLESTGYVSAVGSPFIESMKKSVFCFAPCGVGYGVRHTQSVLLGCIPVIVQPDVALPFDGELVNWSDFSVILEKDDIPNLPRILRSFTKNDIRRMREAMKKVWMRFVWASSTWNPFSSLPVHKQNELGVLLSNQDVVMSILEILGKRRVSL